MKKAYLKLVERRHQTAKEIIPEFNIVKGDKVRVIAGAHAGQEGVVKTVRRKRNQLFIKDVNVRVNTRTRTSSGNGFFYKRESHIHYSNVALVDPATNETTQVRRMRQEDGKRVRVAVASNTVLPEHPYVRGKRNFNAATDTSRDIVNEITFRPVRAANPAE